MRFNSKELAIFACTRTVQFKKEGLLWFKEKEGKIFNKTESFSIRLVRLYGNLLFYFKGKDIASECSGVVVLEKYNIMPDSSQKEFGFSIHFFVEEEQKYEFAADQKKDYDEWITLLKSASIDKLGKKLQMLCTEIQALTEEDPYSDYYPLESLKRLKTTGNRMSLYTHQGDADDVGDGDEQLLEIAITCSDLMVADEHIPCPMIHVFTVVPPSTRWMKHSQTEIYEKTVDPVFLRTIVFASSFPPITRIKFVIHDVLSKNSSRTVIIGQIVCTLQDILKAPELTKTFRISDSEGQGYGSLSVLGWKCISQQPRLSPFVGLKERVPSTFNVKSAVNFTDQHKRRFFHVPTKDGKGLKFQDILMETTLCFKIPKLLLGLFIQEEKEGLVELQSIGSLHPAWGPLKNLAQNYHSDQIQLYSNNLADLCQYDGLNLKKSVEKANKELAFIPTNLHLQRLAVTENDKYEHMIYDIITMGAPSAHSLKFKLGGLKRLSLACDDHDRKTMLNDGEEDIARAKYAKAQIIREKLQNFNQEISLLLSVVQNEITNADQLTESTAQVSLKIGELLTIISSEFVKSSEEELLNARTNAPGSCFRPPPDDANYTQLNWEWTGKDFKAVRSSSSSPYDCNVCDALGRFMGAVNSTFSSCKYDNQENIAILLSRLVNSVKSLIAKTKVLMRFVMMRNQQQDSPISGLRYRKDIVFSQTLTSVVAGFDLFLSEKITNTKVMDQICNNGLLLHFESLLTTGGDEMGMLEDMYFGLTLLKSVRFEIVPSEYPCEPTLLGTRGDLIVQFHVHRLLCETLPHNIKGNSAIRLHPVLFSIGINEQATVAEKFGDITLQENINNESYQFLQIYFDELKKFDPKLACCQSSKSISIEHLMSQLQLMVNIKKSKNFDVLLLTEEMSMRMNGLRFTSCKSAKDRTSMAVTYEMVKILQREHGMTDEIFQHVIDSLRSQGTRLISSFKNVGIPKYAFNKMQVMALPSIYRPPEGTIGKYVQT